VIPLYDENPRSTTPIITLAIIAINVVVFLWQSVAGVNQFAYSMVPAIITGSGPGLIAQGNQTYQMSRAALSPEWLTVFSSMFMHGGLLHIAGNMLFLWVFGDNVEDSLGHVKYLLFYLACGVVAAATHVLSDPGSQIPTLGASGAIAGVMGGYILLFPNARIKALVPLGFFTTLTSVPAYIVLGFWFLYQLLLGQLGQVAGREGGVAYWAHIGGFIAGVLLIKLFRPRRSRAVSPESRGYDGPWR
jgi:membrane associated rhomboid family serine protease